MIDEGLRKYKRDHFPASAHLYWHYWEDANELMEQLYAQMMGWA